MSFWYAVSLVAGRYDVADVAWGLGFVLVAVVLIRFTGNLHPTSFLVAVLVTLWGVRLAVHIGLRLARKPEDPRYVSTKRNWKHPKIAAFPKVFLLQAGFLVVVAAPIIVAACADDPRLAWYNWLGVAVWLAGFFFEAVGDWQLEQFKKQPSNQGRVMRSGLWRYTRHPNYFGEITQWWGVLMVILFVPYWYVGVIGPVTITFLILGVSGIPMLERRYQGNPEYEAYQRRTSAFFPMPPKKS